MIHQLVHREKIEHKIGEEDDLHHLLLAEDGHGVDAVELMHLEKVK